MVLMILFIVLAVILTPFIVAILMKVNLFLRTKIEERDIVKNKIDLERKYKATQYFEQTVNSIMSTEIDATIIKTFAVDKEINVPNLNEYIEGLVKLIIESLSDEISTEDSTLMTQEYMITYIRRLAFSRSVELALGFNDDYRKRPHQTSQPDFIHRY